MSEGTVRGIIVAHGDMASGIVDAALGITGADASALTAISNRGLSPHVLADRVREARGVGPVIVFTDLQAGSCGITARLLSRDAQDTATICGVNLPMLLEFLTHRELPLAELVPRLVQKARSSIGCVPASLQPYDPAVSR
jgi:mannose/fructose-specific phosphotransferase system component IIA